MDKPTVTFETKCWERDWKYVLDRDRMTKMISYHNYPFAERILYINNVEDVPKVAEQAEQRVAEGLLTSYFVVDDHADATLQFFQIDRDSFRGGYYYSIAELVSIYLARTDYVLHTASDTILSRPFDWVTPSLHVMERNDIIKAANPMWNPFLDGARLESHGEDELFLYSFGFSDQCYLVRTRDFRQPIYNEYHPASERYPKYGGELFEKRVDSWMRNHAYQRITYQHGYYIHRNFA